jgi:putative oxidoreductase
MRKIFAVRPHGADVDFVLLLIRIVVGIAFLYHGWGKIQNPMAWMGPDAEVPGWLQALAALSEFGGGIALIFGLFTRLAAFGLMCTMAFAVHAHAIKMGDPFVNLTGGRSFEPAAIYLLIAILFLVLGPGRFSLDSRIFGSSGAPMKKPKIK